MIKAQGGGSGSMVQGSVRIDGDKSDHGDSGAGKVEVKEEEAAQGPV